METGTMPSSDPNYRRAVLLLLIFVSVLPLNGAIQIANFSAATNDRFANDPQFIADSFDLSGVGRANTGRTGGYSGDDGGRWMTMLSPNVFIGTHHFFPRVGESVTFFPGNDPTQAGETRTVQSLSARLGTSDLRLGVLDNPLGSSFTFYDYARENIVSSTDFSNSSLFGANAYLFGRSPNSYPVSQDMAVGRNVLDVWVESRTAAGATDVAIESRVDAEKGPSNNYVDFEAGLQPGDSGGPLFVANGMGGLTIVGINWYILNDTNGNVVRNGHSYIGNHSAEIDAFIAANPVPEPAVLGVVFGLAVFLLALRRRATWTRRCDR